VGFDLAAFNSSGQMKRVQDIDFLYIRNSPTTAELLCVHLKIFLHKKHTCKIKSFAIVVFRGIVIWKTCTNCSNRYIDAIELPAR